MSKSPVVYLALSVLLLITASLSAQFAGGSGSEQDPYLVETALHLDNVRYFPAAFFLQTADIDLGIAPWNEAQGWQPIGSSYYAPFSGVYNGGGWHINGLYILRPSGIAQGLFGYATGDILHLGMTNVDVQGYYYTGALVGSLLGGELLDCFSSGSVKGECDTGGLIGSNSQGSIRRCYSTASVSGMECSGGLAGYNDAEISNCYSHGMVSGTSSSGGLVGANYGMVTNCYSTGAVINSGSDGGGLLGFNYWGAITNCYWDILSSGQSISAGGAGRSSQEMQYPHAANTFQAWDWQLWKPDILHNLNGGYPYLRAVGDTLLQKPVAAICLEPLDMASAVLPDLSLSWQAVLGSTLSNFPIGYKIYLGTDNPPTNILSGVDLGHAHSFVPNPVLQLNTTYYWQIVPYNFQGEAEACPIWSFSTFGLSYPNVGENWQAGTTRTIRWDAGLASGSYKLFISFDNGTQWNLIANVDAAQAYYHYQVPALNSHVCLLKIVHAANPQVYDICNSAFSISHSIYLPRLELSYPSGEHIHLNTAESLTISWDKQHLDAVSLDFSNDDGISWSEIASGIAQEQYQWILPEAAADHCRIRIRSDEYPDVYDISDYAFQLSHFQILSPIAGGVYTTDYSGTYSLPITWNTTNNALVDISYSADGGSIWHPIAENIAAAQGSFNWLLPEVPSQQYRIRISNAMNDIAFSETGDFCLHNPIRILNANGGGFISAQSVFHLHWQNLDIAANSLIFWEYSLNNSEWVRINESAIAAGAQNMYWHVMASSSETAWLRAVVQGSGRIVAKSEAPFVISEEVFTLFEPNGGEMYYGLQSQNISWYSDTPGFLSISFSSDNGQSWTPLATNMPAVAQNYQWIVPDIESELCRIRLQDNQKPWKRSESATSFKVLNPRPSVDFSASVMSGELPLSVQFEAEIRSGAEELTELLWDFGDGSSSTELNPLHIYLEAGIYTVSLWVQNSQGFGNSMVKEDYIKVYLPGPRLELIGEMSLDFGTVPVNESSMPQSFWLKNSGSANLIISSLALGLAESPFHHSDISLPFSLAINDSLQISIVFSPTEGGAVNDSLFVYSNAVNMPRLAINLCAVGAADVNAPNYNLRLSIADDDLHITWDVPASTNPTQGNKSLSYIVLFSENPYAPTEDYYFLSLVRGSSYVHRDVVRTRDFGFYRIVAVESTSNAAYRYLEHINQALPWKEIKRGLRSCE